MMTTRLATLAGSVLMLTMAPSCAPAPLPCAQASTGSTPSSQPVAVPFELGNTGFAAGDAIKISRVSGDRPTIAVGGTYLVEGAWTLRTAPSASLSLYSTNGDLSGSRTIHVSQGQGQFAFQVTVVREGYLHVSFYGEPSGHSLGGTYFGSGDNVYRGQYVPGPDGAGR